MPKFRTLIYFAGALAVVQIGATVLGASPGHAADDTSQTKPAVKTGTMSQPVGTPEKPKNYQPENPSPDLRSAPTSSSSGVGPDSGGQPKDQPK